MKKIYSLIMALITLSLIIVFVACEKDEDIDLTTISVLNEQFTPSYTSAFLQSCFTTKATLRNVYVEYAITPDFSKYEKMEMLEEDDVYSVKLDKLQDNTIYYVRYAVKNSYSSTIMEEISTFKTLQPSVPTITVETVSDIWDVHAKAHIALEFDGGTPITEMGICWNTQAAPVVENNKLTTKDTLAVLEIKALEPNTQYFVRAYAANKMGVAYSEEYKFTTLSLPEVHTEHVTNIRTTFAQLQGALVFNGNDDTTIKGFCWSTHDGPSIEDEHIAIDTVSTTYTYHLSSLIDETQYYVRAYAQNKIGIVYGESKSFTTRSAVIPTVTTSSVTNISCTSAIVDGNVISDGGITVIERGVVYSTNQNPTISNNKVTGGSGIGQFSCSLINLQDGTTYHARAYAINKKGIAYGEEINFTTLSANGHTYVDLGLSVKWATMNVGAESPEDYGDYFAWGEVEPKEVYAWNTYKWYNGSSSIITKYNGEDNKTVLESLDDAATVNWGGAWRMPTYEEWTELYEQCAWIWITQNGVAGYKVTATNGNSIFLPAAGSRYISWFHDAGVHGYYWSNEILQNHIYFPSGVVRGYYGYRESGASVRPICP